MALPTTFTAGVRLRVSQLVAMLTVLRGFLQSGVGTATASVTLTNALQDIAGCSKSVTVVGANAHALVIASVQFSVTGASAGTTIAVPLLVDGVQQAGLGTLRDSMDQVHDGHRSFAWVIPAASLPAGVHTFKIQAAKSAAAGTAAVSNTAGTNIVVILFDLP